LDNLYKSAKADCFFPYKAIGHFDFQAIKLFNFKGISINGMEWVSGLYSLYKTVQAQIKMPPEGEEKFPREASYRHLPGIPSHGFLQKARG